MLEIGPPTRGLVWEATAAPDIRKQCAIFVRQLVEDMKLASR